ncbi:MAG: methylmalonyl-CoA epimerase [Silvanigrellaceae bacterium]|nr:methylmalonyl-CoA epimerase [Silvanigrellaceae bacterium]
MKIIKINHLGIVPKDMQTAKSFFTNILQLPYEGQESVADQKVIVDFLTVGDSRLELLSPLTLQSSSSSPITKFLETKGGGIHHIALEVDNLEEWLVYLKENKVDLIDKQVRGGAHDTKIAFLHPRATGGILVELVEQH